MKDIQITRLVDLKDAAVLPVYRSSSCAVFLCSYRLPF